MSDDQMSPAERRLRRKKREAQVGLANNAFGATAGAFATKLAYQDQRKRLRGVVETGPPKVTRTERALTKLKVKPKYVLPAVATVAVGSQLVNGAMDAQSAQYFGRELKTIREKEQRMHMAKSYEDVFPGAVVPTSEVGKALVSKKERHFDPEADRQRRLGIYEGAGLAAGAATTGAGVLSARNVYRGAKGTLKLTPEQVKALKAIKVGRPAGLLATGAGLTGLGVAAHRRAKSARNERWH